MKKYEAFDPFEPNPEIQVPTKNSGYPYYGEQRESVKTMIDQQIQKLESQQIVKPGPHTYSIRFAITDPESRRFSAEYMPLRMRNLDKEQAFEVCKNIVDEIESCRYFAFSFPWEDEEGTGKDVWFVHKPGCKQLLQIIRSDGKVKNVYQKEVPVNEKV